MKPEASWGEVTDDSNIICPNCGYRIEGWDYNLPEDDDRETIECDECGKSFQAWKTVTVTYTTTEILGTVPCSLCNGTHRVQYEGREFDCYCDNGRKLYTEADKQSDVLMGRTTDYTPLEEEK